MYSYNESARNHAKKLLPFGLIILLVCGGFIYNIVSQGKPSGYIMIFVLSLVAIPGLLMTITAIMQIIKGGEWNIQVTEDRIIWETPAYLGESFTYPFSEISHIEKRINKKKKAKSGLKVRYWLVTKNDKQHRLVKQSSVDIDALIAVLEQAGVHFTDVEIS